MRNIYGQRTHTQRRNSRKIILLACSIALNSLEQHCIKVRVKVDSISGVWISRFKNVIIDNQDLIFHIGTVISLIVSDNM